MRIGFAARAAQGYNRHAMPRPPTPTALRLVQQGGKLRARHANRAATEPHPELGLCEPPEHLNSEQRAIWVRLTGDSPAGLLTKVDGDVFEGYCVLVQARNQAVRKFNESGAEVLSSATPGRARLVGARGPSELQVMSPQGCRALETWRRRTPFAR